MQSNDQRSNNWIVITSEGRYLCNPCTQVVKWRISDYHCPYSDGDTASKHTWVGRFCHHDPRHTNTCTTQHYHTIGPNYLDTAYKSVAYRYRPKLLHHCSFWMPFEGALETAFLATVTQQTLHNSHVGKIFPLNRVILHHNLIGKAAAAPSRSPVWVTNGSQRMWHQTSPELLRAVKNLPTTD